MSCVSGAQSLGFSSNVFYIYVAYFKSIFKSWYYSKPCRNHHIIFCCLPSQVLVPTVSMVGKHLGARKDHPGLKAKENDENCGPTTTVFVGNISEKASDMLIRQLLAVSSAIVCFKCCETFQKT